MNPQRPIKVAIVGGGCASIAAAFELTRPEHEGRYQVTVYQLGYRLGGKGASGRGRGSRIEEHGLHVWLGWYENAFRLMRECYAELARDPGRCRIATWRDAFAPAPFVGAADHTVDGQWVPWTALLPPSEGLPGDPLPDGQRWSMRDYLMRTAALLGTLFRTIQAREAGRSPTPDTGRVSEDQAPDAIRAAISRFLGYGELATLAGLVQGVALLEVVLGSLARYPQNLVLRLLDAIAGNARAVLEARLEEDFALRRVWHVIDLSLATIRGEIRFGIVTDPRGFDAIDEYDCREWLLLNGASASAADSGFLRALYDLGFSYEDGDRTRPRVAAGQALRGLVRAFFTYRGAFFWKMQAGMGDIVFAPFYEVLKRRGVRFEFFHRLENVRVVDRARLGPADPPYVEALEFDVQAEIVGAREYQPLIDVEGLPCWPAAPDWRQLVDGVRLESERRDFESHWDRRKTRTRTLRVIDDFDLVVLGIGIGAVPHACREIVARDPRWRAMIDHVKTTATQAFQLWMSADMRELGWPDAPVTLSGFAPPFDTWADMGHLLVQESWEHAPRALAYFCSVLPDADGPDPGTPGYSEAQRERVRQNAIRFLNEKISDLWRHAGARPGQFRWDVLVDPDEEPGGGLRAVGEARFASQFWTANVNPTDRYTLSLPGSAAYRISPLDRSYDNLTIAGDWTDCGFNGGCVEAAMMSGLLAAHALTGAPRLEDIVGYDHP